MLGKRLRIGVGTQPLEQPRGSLHIGKEKGDGPARKILAHAARSSACRSIASSPAAEAKAQDARNRERLGAGRTGRFDPYPSGKEKQARAKRGSRS
jgi:hypothetical protein